MTTAGMESQIEKPRLEPRAAGRHANVTGQSQIESGTDGGAVDGCNGG